MATESESLRRTGLPWRTVKGWLFEAVLVGATLVGVLSLAALFALIGKDAIGPTAAEPAWYLLYFATLVAPVSGYTLYVRQRPAARRVNATAFVVVFGSVALSLVAFMIPDALDPYDALVFFLVVTVPPAAVVAYTRSFGENNLTGPALPVSIVAGVIGGFLLYDWLIALVDMAAVWITYFVMVTVPVAGLMGWATDRRDGRRTAILASGFVLAVGGATAAIALGVGIEPSLWVVLASGALAPTTLFVVDTYRRRPEGLIGLLGPALLLGGALLGAWLEARLGIAGVDSWLRPTLLRESWSDFRPRQAGIYPQLVGSILIVGSMAVLSFPVGVGAAVYLEEYAPSKGTLGLLAVVLDVNISNLAGVPSVVYGLLGLALFRQVLGLRPGIVVAAGATLGLLILPIVIVSTQEALRSVPDELRRGSYGLGASRWQTVRNVVLPEAVPGILTGTILALGRAIGETAPLVMIGVATTRFSPPEGLFSGATALPLQIFAAKGNNIPEYRTGVVAATAIVLLLLMLLMNATAIAIRRRHRRE